ncbi:hypothetical protein CWC29_015495 [Pseudoalteromonas sp. S4498]|uniref:hypothetical protein n=1 Tax=Pseudoalteromonas TaxID=53246 RepID=UPI0011081535|nr:MULTISPECIES: hypothetical protein [Pseudoalteromonas]MCG9758364.1 hypothetical protein [Pseudoalteromonas sp. Isolate6]NKC20207.1 hypothetical protein [Pseudoalteromonas galatheae]
MTIFDELEKQYFEIDNDYSFIEFDAISKGWNKKAQKYARKRELNDQAYFLFMFTRLEDRVRQESAKKIVKKKASTISWKNKAAWDILPSNASAEMNFKNRLALLTPKGQSDFNIVADYYKERNAIGHGGTFTSPINMPHVISEYKRLYRTLKA